MKKIKRSKKHVMSSHVHLLQSVALAAVFAAAQACSSDSTSGSPATSDATANKDAAGDAAKASDAASAGDSASDSAAATDAASGGDAAKSGDAASASDGSGDSATNVDTCADQYNAKTNGVKAIIDAKCATCHGPTTSTKQRPYLTTLVEVKAELQSSLDQVNSDTMPKKGSPQLTTAEKTQLLNWFVTCGAVKP